MSPDEPRAPANDVDDLDENGKSLTERAIGKSLIERADDDNGKSLTERAVLEYIQHVGENKIELLCKELLGHYEESWRHKDVVKKWLLHDGISWRHLIYALDRVGETAVVEQLTKDDATEPPEGECAP